MAQDETGRELGRHERYRGEYPIIVEGLKTAFGPQVVHQDLDLKVRRGEILGVVGGSGTGKSVLMRAIIGLQRPTEGEVSVFGRSIAGSDPQREIGIRSRWGVLFQGGALFSSMTVGENVMLPLFEHTKLDRKTMEIMTRMKLQVVELGGFENLMPSELSGGMIKRAAFARAIVMDPKILFCDEPSAGLDPVVASQLDDLILLLRDALGMTVVVVTHELESAFKIADRITVLDRGEILFIGTPDELRASDNQRIQNLLNRVAEDDTMDAETYLNRLTGDEPAYRPL